MVVAAAVALLMVAGAALNGKLCCEAGPEVFVLLRYGFPKARKQE